MELKCKCGQDLTLSVVEPSPGQEGDKFVVFCPNPKCRKRWELKDTTIEYEEMIMNEVITPENQEYIGTDDLWYYKDGFCME